MIEALPLPAIEDEPPAGPNLENDPAFREMLQAAKGKEDSQFDEATPPDWKEAATQATGLLERTRDLRILVTLAIARLNLEDLPGFAATLVTIRSLMETMWEDVHPRLDPDDDNDPIMRSNALADLSNHKVVRALRELNLVRTRTQHVAWRDIAVAIGAMEAEAGRDKLSEAEIRGTFADADAGKLAATMEALSTAIAELAAIPKAFDEKAGAGQGPDFRELPKLAYTILTETRRYIAEPGEAARAEDDAPPEEGGAGAAARPARAARSFTTIRNISALDSREDALHALMLASSFFRAHEPSSPLPLLIDRAARLAPMAFMDILRDLAPDGLTQAQLIAGAGDEA